MLILLMKDDRISLFHSKLSKHFSTNYQRFLREFRLNIHHV